MPNPYQPVLAQARDLQLLPGGDADRRSSSNSGQASSSTQAAGPSRPGSFAWTRDAVATAQAYHAARGLSLELQAHSSGASARATAAAAAAQAEDAPQPRANVADASTQRALAELLEAGTSNNTVIVQQQHAIAAR